MDLQLLASCQNLEHRQQVFPRPKQLLTGFQHSKIPHIEKAEKADIGFFQDVALKVMVDASTILVGKTL